MPENFVAFISTHQWILLLAAAWIIPWKGVALWRAARNQSVAWFIVLLIINTLGILDIIYIFVFSRKKSRTEPAQEPEKKALDIKTEPKADLALDDKSQKG